MKAKARIISFIVAAIAAVSMFAGVMSFAACGGTTINISGSTSVEPIMQELIAEYTKTHDVVINVTGSGSSAGITDAQQGNVDFGMSSRELKSTETGVKAVKIATDGIAVIVNKESTVTNVTSDELYNLYANGTAIQGLTVGYGREAGSGTRSAFDELIKNSNGDALEDLESGYNKTAIQEQNSTGGVKTGVSSNKNAIGYISLGSVDETIKAVQFNGVDATAENVANGSYKLARPFNLVVPESGVSDAAQEFIDFILSEEGQAIIEAGGYIKV